MSQPSSVRRGGGERPILLASHPPCLRAADQQEVPTRAQAVECAWSPRSGNLNLEVLPTLVAEVLRRMAAQSEMYLCRRTSDVDAAADTACADLRGVLGGAGR